MEQSKCQTVVFKNDGRFRENLSSACIVFSVHQLLFERNQNQFRKLQKKQKVWKILGFCGSNETKAGSTQHSTLKCLIGCFKRQLFSLKYCPKHKAAFLVFGTRKQQVKTVFKATLPSNTGKQQKTGTKFHARELYFGMGFLHTFSLFQFLKQTNHTIGL